MAASKTMAQSGVQSKQGQGCEQLQMSIPFAAPTSTTPRQRVEMACCWAADGYGSADGKWMRLVRLCENQADAGAPLLRRGDLYILAQQQGLPVSVCKEFRFDNNLWSALSRYLLMFRPALAKVIHPRKADIDKVNMAEVWHDTVNPGTFFFADTWQDAVQAYELRDASA